TPDGVIVTRKPGALPPIDQPYDGFWNNPNKVTTWLNQARKRIGLEQGLQIGKLIYPYTIIFPTRKNQSGPDYNVSKITIECAGTDVYALPPLKTPLPNGLKIERRYPHCET